MSRLRDAKAPPAPSGIGRYGPIGGVVMNRKMLSLGLIAVRFEPLRNHLWKTETRDRTTGEDRGPRWIERKGIKYTISKLELR